MKKSVIILICITSFWLMLAITLVVGSKSRAGSDSVTVSGEVTEIRTYAGLFRVTTYCSGSCCNGKWAGYPTKSGEPLEVGKTIAVDPSVIPLGADVKLILEDGRRLYREAQDTGNAIKGNVIDLLVDDCSGQITYENVEIWVLEEETNEKIS